MCVVDHLPFLLTSVTFRVFAIIISVTYLNSFGFIPIGVFWLVRCAGKILDATKILMCVSYSVILGQKTFGHRLNDIPLWLVSFTSVVLPVCFTVESIKSEHDRKELIKIQTKTFRAQSMAALFIYGVTIVAVAVLVYLPQDKIS